MIRDTAGFKIQDRFCQFQVKSFVPVEILILHYHVSVKPCSNYDSYMELV